MQITTIARLRQNRAVSRMPHMPDTARSTWIASRVVICRFSELDPHRTSHTLLHLPAV